MHHAGAGGGRAARVLRSAARSGNSTERELMEEQTKVPRVRGIPTVRQTDIEPYTALKWVSTLFKAASIFLAVALAGEFVAGMRMEGSGILPQLLGDLARTAVFAVVLWGGGDLVRLLVQLGNDIRAQRILLSRLVYRTPPRDPAEHTGPRSNAGALESDTLLQSGDAAEDAAARRSLGGENG
jgi:hypothetical protein